MKKLSLSEEEEPKGTTLRVYWTVARAGRPIRLSDVQREARLSSASLAAYHLRKLIGMGLVREEQSGYVVEKLVLHNFFRIKRKIVPFQVAYIVFFSGILIALVSLEATGQRPLSSFDFISLVAVAVALLIFIYEMFRTINSLP